MTTESNARADGARRTGPALEATCRFVLWLVPTVERFPRSRRFLPATALDVLDRLIGAACRVLERVAGNRRRESAALDGLAGETVRPVRARRRFRLVPPGR